MNILAISGKRGSGKSMLASFLSIYGYTQVSLAEELKKRCQMDFGLTWDQTHGQFKEHPTSYKRTDGRFLTPRDIMIRCGIYYRSIDPLFWCKTLKQALHMEELRQINPKFVIDDIRFINEIEYFKKLGAKFIRLERDQKLNVYKAAMDDLSETELDAYKHWDFKLDAINNKTPEDLKIFAEAIANGC